MTGNLKSALWIFAGLLILAAAIVAAALIISSGRFPQQAAEALTKAKDSEKAETKDEKLARILVGTWILEEGGNQVRQIFQADGTFQIRQYTTSRQESQRVGFEHRYLRATGQDATLYHISDTHGRWWFDSGRLFFDSSGREHSMEISEFTTTSFILTKMNGSAIFTKLSRWDSMTDSEMLALHKRNRILLKNPHSKK